MAIAAEKCDAISDEDFLAETIPEEIWAKNIDM